MGACFSEEDEKDATGGNKRVSLLGSDGLMAAALSALPDLPIMVDDQRRAAIKFQTAFRGYKARKWFQAARTQTPRPVRVVVRSASGLRAADTHDSDPYVYCSVRDRNDTDAPRHGSFVYKTSVVSSTLNPVWEEDNTFWIPDVCQSLDLIFTVCDKDLIMRDDFLGQCIVSGEDAWHTDGIVEHPLASYEVPVPGKTLGDDDQPGQGSLTLHISHPIPLARSHHDKCWMRQDTEGEWSSRLYNVALLGVKIVVYNEWPVAVHEWPVANWLQVWPIDRAMAEIPEGATHINSEDSGGVVWQLDTSAGVFQFWCQGPGSRNHWVQKVTACMELNDGEKDRTHAHLQHLRVRSGSFLQRVASITE